jgi:hypothetical protein
MEIGKNDRDPARVTMTLTSQKGAKTMAASMNAGSSLRSRLDQRRISAPGTRAATGAAAAREPQGERDRKQRDEERLPQHPANLLRRG